MPKKGYKQTSAHRKKHSISKKEYYKTHMHPLQNTFASEATKRKQHFAHLGRNNARFGVILSKKIRQKISLGNKGKQAGKNNPMYGVHRFGKAAPNFGNVYSKETRAKIGIKNANQPKETRKKQRLAALRRISIQYNNGNPIMPSIGKNETKILNYIEKQNNIILERQYPIDGYFIDGYCKETNTAYEVDEYHHCLKKNKLRDKKRKKYIKDKLKCKFVRLDEKKYLKKLKTTEHD